MDSDEIKKYNECNIGNFRQKGVKIPGAYLCLLIGGAEMKNRSQKWTAVVFRKRLCGLLANAIILL